MSFEAIDLHRIIRDTVKEYRRQVWSDVLVALSVAAVIASIAYVAIYLAS
jgi:hypothetical protein